MRTIKLKSPRLKNKIIPILAAFFMTLFLSPLAYGQSLRFGKVPKEEVMMTVYAADSSAVAVVLGETGFSTLKYEQVGGYFLNHTRHTRIKILKKEGYEWADVSVPLYGSGGDSETLRALKASTYNMENGKVKVTKLDKSAVFDEAVSASRSYRKFTLPNVREGSVIEYSYTIRSKYYFNLQGWQFQNLIPKVWSKYTVEIPEYFVYNKDIQGFHPLTEDAVKPGSDRITFTSKGRQQMGAFDRTSGGGNAYRTEQISVNKTIYKMLAENVPAFKREPFMGDWIDYVSQVRFAIQSVGFPGQSIRRYGDNWQGLNLSMERHSRFGQMTTGANFLDAEVKNITNAAQSDIEKVAVIQQYVKAKTAWNGVHRLYATRLTNSLLEEGEGTSADINLLLTNMLRKAGFDADPVMISTRGHGRIDRGAPQSQQFNHVIAAVDIGEGTLLLDATERNLPFNLLPKKCLNGEGWRVSEKRSGWVPLRTTGMDGFLFNGDFTISEERKLIGKTDIRYSQYQTRPIRYKAAYEEEELVKDFAEKYSLEFKDWTVSGAKELSKPITLSASVATDKSIDEAGDLLFINPYLITQWDENPFSDQERRYPVDFVSKQNYRYYFTLTLPEGYTVEELPDNVNIALENNAGKFMYLMKQSGNVITFRSIFSLNQTIFSPYGYEGLRDFFTKMIEQQSAQIVLKKVG